MTPPMSTSAGRAAENPHDPRACQPHPGGTGRNPATGTHRTGRHRRTVTTTLNSGEAVLPWLLIAIAIPLLVAGVLMPSGLVIAAGLVLAGLTGLAKRR